MNSFSILANCLWFWNLKAKLADTNWLLHVCMCVYVCVCVCVCVCLGQNDSLVTQHLIH